MVKLVDCSKKKKEVQYLIVHSHILDFNQYKQNNYTSTNMNFLKNFMNESYLKLNNCKSIFYIIS